MSQTQENRAEVVHLPTHACMRAPAHARVHVSLQLASLNRLQTRPNPPNITS